MSDLKDITTNESREFEHFSYVCSLLHASSCREAGKEYWYRRLTHASG